MRLDEGERGMRVRKRARKRRRRARRRGRKIYLEQKKNKKSANTSITI